MTTSNPNAVPPSRDERPVDARRSDAHQTDALVRIAKVHVAAVGIAVGVVALWLFSDVILLLFAAILVACQLRGAAHTISRRLHLPYGIALAIVVLALGATFVAISYWSGSRLVNELHTVYDQVDQQISELWRHTDQANWLQSVFGRVNQYLNNKGNVLAGTAAGFVTTTIGSLGSLLLVCAAAIYLAASTDVYERGLVRLLPRVWRPRAHEVMAHEARTLRRWFLGQLVDMLAIGLMAGVGLWLLGVPLSPTLGLIAAVANFVPYVGALAGSLPAIVVGLGRSPETALWVAVLFVVVQTIEGYLVSPLISRRTVHLPPALTLFSQTVLGVFYGPLGLILATPITAAVMVLVKMVYVEGVLGDE